MDVYSRSTLFTTIYYLFLAVFVTFKNNTVVLAFFFCPTITQTCYTH